MKKTTIVLNPYTIIALLGKPGSGKVFWYTKQIEPVLNSHSEIKWQFAEAKLNIELKDETKILIVSVSSVEELLQLKEYSNKIHFNLLGINVNPEFIVDTNIFSSFIQLNSVEQEVDCFYEEDTTNHFICNEENYVVVSDIHGSYETFTTMLRDNGCIIKDSRILSAPQKFILVGDYIDKGDYKGIRKVIDFLYNNLEHFIICIGNHEYFVAEYLKGNIKPSVANTMVIGQWFQSVVLLLQDEMLRAKFFKIYNNSFHSVETKEAIITHSPCRKKYLRKSDAVSLKAQRNLQYPKSNIDFEFENEEEMLLQRAEFFNFLKEDANDSDKFHIFGHTMVPEIFKFKNKICLDTGCVAGGSLSIAIFEGQMLTLKSYKNKHTSKKEKLFPYFKD
jgi:predicted phosphodiesterase